MFLPLTSNQVLFAYNTLYKNIKDIEHVINKDDEK